MVSWIRRDAGSAPVGGVLGRKWRDSASVSTLGWDAEQGPYSGNGMLSEYRREETGPLSRDGMLS